MKKILLTGANGFLGTELLKVIKNNFEVITLSRNKSDINIDLALQVPYFSDLFHLVIHASGKAHNTSKTSNDDFHKVNVIGTSHLLKGFENSIIPKKFVFISSVAVYGLDEGISINEDYPLIANEPYGKSKIDAENLIIEWCTANDVVGTILRLPLVVGSNPPGNFGAMIKGIETNRYFNIGGGKVRKSMVLAQDVAEYILKVSEIGGIYNLTDGIHPSFFELSENISQQLGKGRPRNLPIWLAKVFAKIGDLFGARAPLNSDKLCKITSDLTFDDSKARVAFGWDPTPVLEGFMISDKK